MKIKAFILLIRPEQWIKNFFIFTPLFFANKILNTELLINAILGFLCFSLIASSIYIVNDYFDREKDRQHPKKKDRPIASGRINKNFALKSSIFIFFFGILLSHLFFDLYSILILIFYGFINLLYSYKLKRIALVDVIIVSFGFVIRVIYGGSITQIPISHWLIVMTYLLSLFIVFAKRRSEYIMMNEKQTNTRVSMYGYNKIFLDQAMVLVAGITIVAYIIYTTDTEVINRFNTEKLYFTSFFVLLGILRFLQLSSVYNRITSPTKIIYFDRFLQLIIVSWILSFIWIIYIN